MSNYGFRFFPQIHPPQFCKTKYISATTANYIQLLLQIVKKWKLILTPHIAVFQRFYFCHISIYPHVKNVLKTVPRAHKQRTKAKTKLHIQRPLFFSYICQYYINFTFAKLKIQISQL